MMSRESVCSAPRRREEEWKVRIIRSKPVTSVDTQPGGNSLSRAYTGSEVRVRGQNQVRTWNKCIDIELCGTSFQQ